MQPSSRVSRRRHMRQWPIYLGMVFALLLILSACGGATGPTAGTTPTLPPGCAKNSSLTLVSAVGYGTDAAAAFHQQTGVPVRVIPFADHYDGAYQVGAWDVAWLSELLVQKADNKGALLKWNSPNLGTYTSLGARLVPADHSYYPTGVSAAGVIVYNLNHVPAAGLPTTWTDLEKTAYKDEVAETSLFWSSTTYTTVTGISQLLGGPVQGTQFLLGLKTNGSVFPGDDALTLKLVESGAREFGIVQDSSYYLARHQGQPLGIIYPATGVVALTTNLGIAATSTRQACAEQFVNWVLSPAGQTVLTHHDPSDNETYFIPLIAGITPVVNRQTSGLHFVPYNVVKWAPLALAQRLWVDSHVQSAHAAVSQLLGGDGTRCSGNCDPCFPDGC